MRHRSMLTFIVMLLFAASASAQVEACIRRGNDISARFNNPPPGMTEEQAQAFLSDNMRELISVDLDCFLWEPEMHRYLSAYETPQKPQFSITHSESIETDFSTAFVDANGVINIPQELPFYILAISTFISHDAYVRDRTDPFDANASFKDTPCRRSTMVPLLTPFFNFLRLNAFQQVGGIVSCKQDDQRRFLQNFAEMITTAFILLHENAHQRLGHQAAQVHTLSQELAADASALSALKIMREKTVQGLPEDTADRIRWMFNVAPVLWLSADAERVQTSDADTRLSAALKFDPDLTDELSRYVKPSRVRRAPSVARITFDHPVSYYIVDGVRLSKAQVPTGGLLLSSGLHNIVAVCSDGMAMSRGVGDANYTFLPFSQQPGASVVAHDGSDPRKAILEASNGDFHPKSSDVAWPWANALHTYHWSQWVDDSVLQQLTDAQREKVRGWQESDALLASWR